MVALANGVNYSSVNIQVFIPVIGIVVGITKIQYGKEQTIDDNYALGQDPVSRGYGQNKYSGSISLYKETWNKIIDASPLKDPLALPPFEITVVFGGAATGGYRKETLHAVNFKANPMTANSGDTKLILDIPLAIGGIDYV
jgi:hypothetical protein